MQPLKDYFYNLENFDDKDVEYSKPIENKTHIIPPEPPKAKKVLNIKLPQNNNEEDLFKKSKTDIEKKQQWVEVYRKGINSKKQNSFAKAIRLGQFTITEKGDVMILPKLDVSGNSKTILNKQWLKK